MQILQNKSRAMIRILLKSKINKEGEAGADGVVEGRPPDKAGALAEGGGEAEAEAASGTGRSRDRDRDQSRGRWRGRGIGKGGEGVREGGK